MCMYYVYITKVVIVIYIMFYKVLRKVLLHKANDQILTKEILKVEVNIIIKERHTTLYWSKYNET